MAAQKTTIELDWNRLLGFDQIADHEVVGDGATIKDPRLAKVGGKIGGKGGLKPFTRS